jgi:hypothetical protein
MSGKGMGGAGSVRKCDEIRVQNYNLKLKGNSVHGRHRRRY